MAEQRSFNILYVSKTRKNIYITRGSNDRFSGAMMTRSYPLLECHVGLRGKSEAYEKNSKQQLFNRKREAG